MNKGLLYCGECEDFPCNELFAFYKDGILHHELAYKNILSIRKIGVESWLIQQEEEHTCKCGRKKRWFATKCSDEDCNL